MKPTWDALGSEYAHSSSVVIGDADCTVEKDLCSTHGVSGYPTIKYYTGETGRDGAAYNGGRDESALKAFVEDTLAKACDVQDEATCDERENKYINKMKAAPEKQAAQLARLSGMKGNSMKADLKAWLFQRINILEQLSSGKAEL